MINLSVYSSDIVVSFVFEWCLISLYCADMVFWIVSEGCGFVKYSQRDMALAAINALNGIYTMRVSCFCYLSFV